MSDKFQYAPGRPGYGNKGDRGDDGMQGMSMYFTDLDPIAAANTINLRITNNAVLWSDSIADLPNSRVYITGDLFFDNTGKCYEINAESNTFSYKLSALTLGGLFNPLGVTTLYGFERYFNSNTVPKYIVDNVYTAGGAINYSSVPEKIYNVPAKDYTRNEFTNVVHNSTYNAFTVYSASAVPATNNRSIALVRQTATNTFRLGNLDDAGNLRNVNLTFDVSLLIHNKSAAHQFDASTPSGAILTNYEINANSLFDPIFNSCPSSFNSIYTSYLRTARINWVLSDFVGGDSDVTGDLYFFKDVTPYNAKSYRVTDPSISPLVFSDIDSSGYITITNLDNSAGYKIFIKLYKNGWVRTSEVLGAYAGSLTVSPVELLNEPSAAHSISGFNVTSSFPWDVSLFDNSDEFMTNLSYSVVGDGNYDGSILFDMTENDGLLRRTGTMRVSGAEIKTVNISQRGQAIDVSIRMEKTGEYYQPGTDPESAELWAYYNIYFDNMPSNTNIDASIQFSYSGSNEHDEAELSQIYGETLITLTDSYVSKTDSSGMTYQLLPTSNPFIDNTSIIGLQGLTITDFPLQVTLYARYIVETEGPVKTPVIQTSVDDITHTYNSGTPIYIISTTLDEPVINLPYNP